MNRRTRLPVVGDYVEVGYSRQEGSTIGAVVLTEFCDGTLMCYDPYFNQELIVKPGLAPWEEGTAWLSNSSETELTKQKIMMRQRCGDFAKRRRAT